MGLTVRPQTPGRLAATQALSYSERAQGRAGIRPARVPSAGLTLDTLHLCTPTPLPYAHSGPRGLGQHQTQGLAPAPDLHNRNELSAQDQSREGKRGNCMGEGN